MNHAFNGNCFRRVFTIKILSEIQMSAECKSEPRPSPASFFLPVPLRLPCHEDDLSSRLGLTRVWLPELDQQLSEILAHILVKLIVCFLLQLFPLFQSAASSGACGKCFLFLSSPFKTASIYARRTSIPAGSKRILLVYYPPYPVLGSPPFLIDYYNFIY